MAEIKKNVVSTESLSVLHEYDKNTYMPMVNPSGSGTITIDNINTNSLVFGSSIKLVPTNDRIEIIFLDEES